MTQLCAEEPLWSTIEVSRYLNLPKRQAKALIVSGEFGDIARNASWHFRVSRQQVMRYQPDHEVLRQRFRDKRAISVSKLFWLYDKDL